MRTTRGVPPGIEVILAVKSGFRWGVTRITYLNANTATNSTQVSGANFRTK
jgi:hypothetical protein